MLETRKGLLPLLARLDESEYWKVEELVDYGGLESAFAYAILEKSIPGSVFVDDEAQPRSALICSKQGKVLVLGEEDNPGFISSLAAFLSDGKNHHGYFDLYAASEEWVEILSSKLDGKATILRFCIYYYNPEKSSSRPFHPAPAEAGMRLKKIDAALFEKIANEFDDTYKHHWTNAQEFCEKSFGFCMIHDNEIVGLAGATYTGNGYAEIDIRTRNDHYRKGIAYSLSHAFLEYCALQGLTALWICDSGNKPSKDLANKLGLTRSKEVEMLWWHENKAVMNSYLSQYHYI